MPEEASQDREGAENAEESTLRVESQISIFRSQKLSVTLRTPRFKNPAGPSKMTRLQRAASSRLFCHVIEEELNHHDTTFWILTSSF